MVDTSYWTMLWSVMWGIVAVALIVAILFYVLRALGFHTIAKRRGIAHPWLAWIPIANYYLIGRIADEYDERFFNKRSSYAALLLAMSLMFVVMGIIIAALITPAMLYTMHLGDSYGAVVGIAVLSIAMPVVSIILTVLYFICLFKIYDWCSASSGVMIVFSILFRVVIPFMVFAVRNGNNPRLHSNGPQGGRPRYYDRPPQLGPPREYGQRGGQEERQGGFRRSVQSDPRDGSGVLRSG